MEVKYEIVQGTISLLGSEFFYKPGGSCNADSTVRIITIKINIFSGKLLVAVILDAVTLNGSNRHRDLLVLLK